MLVVICADAVTETAKATAMAASLRSESRSMFLIRFTPSCGRVERSSLTMPDLLFDLVKPLPVIINIHPTGRQRFFLADVDVVFSSASALTCKSLKVFWVTVTDDPSAQKLFLARFGSLLASTAPSSSFGRPAFSQLASKGRWMLIVAKGSGQPGMNLSDNFALRAFEEAAAKQTATVMLVAQRMAWSSDQSG